MVHMSGEDKDFGTIWISHETYRKLLEIKYALMKKGGGGRSRDKSVYG